MTVLLLGRLSYISGSPFSALFVGCSFYIYHLDVGILEGSLFWALIFFVIVVFWRNLILGFSYHIPSL